MTEVKDTQSKQFERLFVLYGDMRADAAHKVIKEQSLMKDTPSRDVVRAVWREMKVKNIEVAYYESDDGKRFMSRQGRYRHCKKTGATPIRE